jgi:predicted hydrolase (HD superfamily)
VSENRSKYEFMQSASLSQKLAFKIPIYQKLAGADPETSLQIAFIETLITEGKIKRDAKVDLLLKLMNAKRQALFATSDKVNEISKMGMQMPKAEEEIDFDKPDSDTSDHP